MNDAIDLDHFEAATFGDRALQHEVLTLFEAQASKLVETIRGEDGKARLEAAHTLKGAASGIGAFALAKAAEAVERDEADALERLAERAAEARHAAASLRARS